MKGFIYLGNHFKFKTEIFKALTTELKYLDP